MGITIYYSGRLRSKKHLPLLINDVVQHCIQNKWAYAKVMSSFEYPIEGIMFEPPGSQTIYMTFLDGGQLISKNDYAYFKSIGERIRKDHQTETKTHFAGAKMHMKIIHYLRHLSDTYFSRFSLHDESEYWQTNDPITCENEFRFMEKWVEQMIEKLDSIDGRKGDVGDSGELMEERIQHLFEMMKPMDVIEMLHTPPPKRALVSFFWN